jgi:FkbM family methyltransferase
VAGILLMNFPISVKALFPGYKAKWRYRYACMFSELRRIGPELIYGADEDGPWIEQKGGGLRFSGFPTESANAEIYDLLKADMPSDMPRDHYRLVKDYLNRFLYPHTRPDLKPVGYPVDQMFGFHGQHKDTIHDLEDEVAKPSLLKAFSPKSGEVVIDCGAFLGFGDMHLSSLVGEAGRIFAIEADPDCYRLLCKNMTYNAIGNVEPIWNAVFDKDDDTVQLLSGFAQGNTLFDHLKKSDATRAVPTIKIDTLCDKFGIERLDMISLTLNGAEPETVDGAVAALRRFRPRIRAAGWYTRDGVKIWQILKDKLVPLGYRIFVGPRGSLLAIPEAGPT